MVRQQKCAASGFGGARDTCACREIMSGQVRCTSGRKIARQVVTVAVVAHSDKPGGAERYLVELYREASSPILLGQLPGWNEAGLPARRVELSPKWSRSTIFGGVMKLPAERRRVLRAVAAEPIDYFHLQFKREQVGFSRELSRIAPVVWTEHGRFIRGPQGALLARAYRRASRHVSGIVCVSETVAKSLAAIVHPSVQLEVIENGVSLEGFRPASEGTKALARRRLGLPPISPLRLGLARCTRARIQASYFRFRRRSRAMS